mmetsp:Transcript_38661/g.114944  ORF Transcript_38661/g.114944 Transcript_38661/m.114944 type:complete len:297 (+) Transcript_38661:1087-1977(+)
MRDGIVAERPVAPPDGVGGGAVAPDAGRRREGAARRSVHVAGHPAQGSARRLELVHHLPHFAVLRRRQVRTTRAEEGCGEPVVHVADAEIRVGDAARRQLCGPALAGFGEADSPRRPLGEQRRRGGCTRPLAVHPLGDKVVRRRRRVGEDAAPQRGPPLLGPRTHAGPRSARRVAEGRGREVGGSDAGEIKCGLARDGGADEGSPGRGVGERPGERQALGEQPRGRQQQGGGHHRRQGERADCLETERDHDKQGSDVLRRRVHRSVVCLLVRRAPRQVGAARGGRWGAGPRHRFCT